MSYHPYHLPSNTDPLYKIQQLLTNPNVGQDPYLNAYPLPYINLNNNNIKEIKKGEYYIKRYFILTIYIIYINRKIKN